MNYTVQIFIAIIITTSSLIGQQNHRGQDNDDHIRSLRIAHITDKLQLTPSESEKFWPIYNEYKANSDKRRNMYYEYRKTEVNSEQEADKLISKMFALDKERIDAKAKLFKDLRTAISPLKIIKLNKAEHEFKREILKRIKHQDNKTG